MKAYINAMVSCFVFHGRRSMPLQQLEATFSKLYPKEDFDSCIYWCTTNRVIDLFPTNHNDTWVHIKSKILETAIP